jgi:chorismate lyase/3-hydroxybenzoate synthase
MSVRSVSETDGRSAAMPHADARGLRVAYEHAELDALLAGADVLAVLGFGRAAPAAHDDPRYLRVALEPLQALAPFEVWRAKAPVVAGLDGRVRFAHDGSLLFGAIEIDEAEISDSEIGEGRFESAIAAVASTGYTELGAFLAGSGYPHPLRIWNYLAAITEGDGDAERYRQFCVGRARGMPFQACYPAATAIGMPASTEGNGRKLQIYFLAAKSPGTALENPRQLAAYRYPRQYGPQPPSFARAMLLPADASSGASLLISGTASVRGHASVHADDVIAQLDETLLNLRTVLDAARELQPALPPMFGERSLLKAYLRDPSHASRVEAELRSQLPADTSLLMLHAEICRAELLIEIDGFHGV